MTDVVGEGTIILPADAFRTKAHNLKLRGWHRGQQKCLHSEGNESVEFSLIELLQRLDLEGQLSTEQLGLEKVVKYMVETWLT